MSIPPSGGSSTGAGQVTDANGNQISVNGSGVFTDTLGSKAVTVAGNGTPASPKTFTYASPSGNAAVTVHYVNKTVKTNFGCANVSEFGPSTIALVNDVTLADGSQYIFQYEGTPGFSGDVTGRISQVTLPTGGQIQYQYTEANDGAICADGSTASLTRTLTPGGQWQYIRTPPGTGTPWVTTVTSPPDPVNVGSASDVTVLNFAKDGSTTNPTQNFYETQRQIYQGPSNLLLTVTKCYNAVYANCATATVSSPITQTDTYSQLPNLLPSGGIRLSEVQYNGAFSGSGLVSDDKEYDYGVAMGAAPGNAKLIRETVIGYSVLGNNIVRPSSSTVKDWTSGTATTLASATYAYDEGTPASTSGTPQHISVTGSRGNLTTVTTSTSSTATLSKTFTYYDTGTPHVANDVNRTSTVYSYSTAVQGTTTASCGNSFPTTVSVTNTGVNLSTSTVWNCDGGVATQTTDPNGNNVSSTYTDPDFWRPANVTDQLLNQTNISYIGHTAVESALQNFNGGNSVSDSRITVDGFGRPTFSQRLQGPGATKYDTAETDYNIMGQPYRSTMPYSAAASPSDNTTAPATTTTYDALGRVATITDANGGTVAYTYTNNDVFQAVSGSQTFKKQLEYDGLGRLTSVCEISSTLPGVGLCGQTVSQTGYLTKYTYDALGHLLTVAQNAQPSTTGQQGRTYTSDMVGRMTSEANPETGTINYTYDSSDSACGSFSSAGDLVEKKDAMNNVTCFKYDGVHRVTQITYPSGTYASATPTKCFVYDSATVNGTAMLNAKSHLAEAYTTTAASCPGTKTVDEGFSYSARGESADVWESTPNSGGYYHVNATYWANGAMNVLNGGSNPLPGLPAITYGASDGSGLDGEGRITKVMASSGQNLVTCSTSPCVSYNVAGQITGVTLGSGDSDAYQYDANTGRLTQYKFNMGTGPQSQTGQLTWSTNGTLQKLQTTDQINTANSQTCTFGYDDLARITGANCGSVWAQTFALDPFGNLSKSGSASFLPTYTGTSGTGTSPSNQYYQIPGGSSGAGNYYDTNGNLKNDIVHTYTWDADGNMLSVDGSTVAVIYDAIGRMAEQTRVASHTQIVYGPYGTKLALMNGQTLVNAFVKLPGGAQAVYKSSGLAYYRHADHLGSSRLSTTPSRTKYYDVAYGPYGEDYNGSGTQDLAFTDQNQDTVGSGWSTNLYDFLMRGYRTAHGRWTSPDPAGLGSVDMSNPQSWNRYAYVGNNPMAWVDPLGLKIDICDECVFLGGVGFGDCTMDGVDTPCDLVYATIAGGGALQCPNNYCGYLPIPGTGGFGLPSYGADGSISWSFTFPMIYAGIDYNSAALAEALGLPTSSDLTGLPQSNAAANSASAGGSQKTNLQSATCDNPYPITNDSAVINASYQNPPPDVTTVQSFFPLGGRCTQIAPNIQCYAYDSGGCNVTMCAMPYLPFVQGAYPGIWVPKKNAPTTYIKEQVCARVK